MKHIREIAVFLFLLILALAAAVRSADAASEIPVYGPAAVAFEDDDIRRETIIPNGVLLVTPEEPSRLWIGDGVTKGGLEVRAKPCVTGFVDVAVATTNLAMGLWPVTFGDWAVRGGENAFGVMRGGNYKFYITYTGETTYAKYLFGMDGDVYTFTCNSVQGTQSPPWLLMTTNLLEDFQRVETGLEYVDSVTARLVWTNDTSADTLFFRVVTDRFEEEALVATVPIHADAGIVATGSITIDGANVATVADTEGLASAAVAPVASRVGAVEERLDYPETCCLYWPPEYVTNNWGQASHTIYIPTNFPTRKLHLVISDNGLTNLNVRLDPAWHPDNDVGIKVHIVRTSDNPTNRAVRVYLGQQGIGSMSAYNVFRKFEYFWDVTTRVWEGYGLYAANRQYWAQDGVVVAFPTNYPATVEEWLALLESRRNPAPSLLSGGPTLLSTRPQLGLAGGLAAEEIQETAVEYDEPYEDEPYEEEENE